MTSLLPSLRRDLGNSGSNWRAAARTVLAAGLLGGGAAIAMAAPPAAPSAAPAASGSTGSSAVVASLGTARVGENDIERLLQSMPEGARAQIKQNRQGMEGWLRERLVTEALLQEAKSKGWTDRPDVKARMEAAAREAAAAAVTQGYLASVTQVPADFPSDADLKSAYEQGKASFAIPATYRLAQIFLNAPAGDDAAIAKARPQAQALATQARSGDFAALAKAQSQDARSAERGGEIGTLAIAQIVPEVREAVTRMQPGQVSDPVQTPAGFHVVKLIASNPERTASFDEVRPRLQQALRQQRQQQLAQSYLEGLAKNGGLKIDSAALDAAMRKVN